MGDRISERGPDCFGYFGIDSGGNAIETKTFLSADWKDQTSALPDYLVLANFRGIPTTECSTSGIGAESVQPYYDPSKTYIVTHNGQLSNDQELIAKHGYPRYMGGDHDIDSYYFINVIRNSADAIDLVNGLGEIEGSFALAAFDRQRRMLHFARDYRGLFFAIWEKDRDRYLVWSSEAESFTHGLSSPYVSLTIKELPIFSALSMPDNWLRTFGSGDFLLSAMRGRIECLSKRSDYNKSSAAVVFSGGLDSTVCVTWACTKYQHVHLLHFLYGSKAQVREVQAVRAICDYLRNRFAQVTISLKFIDLGFIKDLGGSTLTDHYSQHGEGEIGAEKAVDWVPARNISFLGLVASYCDRWDIGSIILGLNMEEGSVFCDNSIEFYQEYDRALQRGTHARPHLVMPVGKSMKHHIVQMGVELHAPLNLSWSCYSGDVVRCGVCGPCLQRQRAYAINGLFDPVPYKQRDQVAQQIYEDRINKVV